MRLDGNRHVESLRRIRKLETRLTDISELFEVRVISAADGQLIDRIACDAARLAYEEHCAKHGCETKF